jgi:hypothetical protein
MAKTSSTSSVRLCPPLFDPIFLNMTIVRKTTNLLHCQMLGKCTEGIRECTAA